MKQSALKILFRNHLLLVLFILFSLVAIIGPVKTFAKSNSTSVTAQYNKAKAQYRGLKNGGHQAKYRDKWIEGIKIFERIVREHPDHELVAPSLYLTGEMYVGLYKWSGSPLDIGFAISYYEDVANKFPDHYLADDSLYKTGLIYYETTKNMDNAARSFAKVIALYPDGDMAADAEKHLKKIRSVNPDISLQRSASNNLLPLNRDEERGKAIIQPLKYWSNPDYTRVVLETSAKINFKENLLEPEGDKPRRLYVDLANCSLPVNYPKRIPIHDGLLRRVRCAQFSPTTVRVVLDTQTFSDYKIFSLNNPFRIVIDVKGEEKKTLTASKFPIAVDVPALQPHRLNACKVVLDPGHGGHDPGAIGSGGLKEKNIVLKVAKKVGRKLSNKLRCGIVYTRDRDIYIPLEERTAIANKNKADLFVSIHANAARDRKARGVETYFLSFAKTKKAMEVAARENASTMNELSDLDTILLSVLQNNKQKESARLAEYIQDNMIVGLSRKYRQVTNLGVKQAPFVVLIGAQMPAILSEISFISNPVEARRLKDSRYLDLIADQLVDGVSKYISDLNVANLR